MKVSLLFFLLLLTTSLVFSQNLIQNSGFEKYHESFFSTYIKNAKNWSIVNRSSPDLITLNNKLNYSNYGKNGYLKCKPYEGYVCAGLILFTKSVYDYREFITNKLEYKLKKDSIYCIEMFVLCRNESPLITNKIQAYFSKQKVRFKSNPPYSYVKKNMVDINNGEYLFKYNWVKICGIYKATGNEMYVTLGLYDDIRKVQYLSNSEARYYDWLGNSSYIFIDNVSLIPIHDSSQCDCNIKRISIKAIQNDSISDEERSRIISKEGTILSLKNLYFDNDSYEIKPESFEELDKLYTLLSSNPGLKISVNGYTDNVGSDKYNVQLSEQRAKAVVDYLIQKGIAEERLNYRGYGKDNPIKTNETEEGRAANRRVEVEFIKG